MHSVELTDRQRHAEGATAGGAAADPESGDEMPLDDAGSRIEQHLAPVDGGIAAWRVLLAAFMFEGCLWGKFHLYCIRLAGQARLYALFTCRDYHG